MSSPEEMQLKTELKETWDRTREMINNENELTNQRLSWLFAGQAFLFAALAVGFNADVQVTTLLGRLFIMFFLLIVIGLGLFSSLTTFRMARDANTQREFAADYWKRQSRRILNLDSAPEGEYIENLYIRGFPERAHGKDLKLEGFGCFRMIPRVELFTRDHTFPTIMSWVWFIVFLMWLAQLFYWLVYK